MDSSCSIHTTIFTNSNRSFGKFHGGQMAVVSTYFDKSRSWLTFTDSWDSCDLLFVSGWNASGWSLLRRCGGGVVGNRPPFDDFSIGGVGGGVWWCRASDGDEHGNGDDGIELEGSGEGDGDGGERVVSIGGRDDVDDRELWANFGELPILGWYVDQCRSILGFPPCAEHSNCNIPHHTIINNYSVHLHNILNAFL